MYRHYQGNSGLSRRIEEQPRVEQPPRGRTLAPMPERSQPPRREADTHKAHEPPNERQNVQSPNQAAPPSPLSGLSGELGKLFGKLGSLSLETEDLLLIAVLYLMYRESGDKELLIMIGALLFL